MKTKKEYLKTEFMGYTIEEVDHRNPYVNGFEFMFYPTHQGEDHDADCDDGETFSYCGNCRWASDLEEAQATIHDLNPLTNTWKTAEDWAAEEADETRNNFDGAHDWMKS